MSNMSYNSSQLGTSQLRGLVSGPKLRGLLADHPVVEVGPYRNERDAVLVAPAVFDKLERSTEELEDLKNILPLLLAAASTGVGLPSETLTRIGVVSPDVSWRSLNALQNRVAYRIAEGEDGERIARGSLTSEGYVGEIDDDLVLIDD